MKRHGTARSRGGFRAGALAVVAIAGFGALAIGQTQPNIVRTRAAVIAIEHVTVIDGTGAPARADQNVLIRDGRIAAVGASIDIPAEAEHLDGHGKTLIPGLVGMHEHLFAPAPAPGPLITQEQFLTAPILYLASGVTTARTAGAADPYSDLGVKRQIEAGATIGPDLDLSTPYLDGSPPSIPQLYPLRDPADARATIRFWRERGFTSVKAYANISPAALEAAIDEAHKLGMKVTGHLCSVGYEQAVGFGIDNLEHGPFISPDGELDARREAGVCKSPTGTGQGAVARDIVPNVAVDGPEIQHLIKLLVARRVPITSTLAVAEGGSDLDLAHNPRLKTLLAPAAWAKISAAQQSEKGADTFLHTRLVKEMAFERAFVAAGGILMIGCDPTGDGHTIAGLGDQRDIELLAQAGFALPQIIRFATLNGAEFLGRAKEIGTISPGKRADLVLLNGDLGADITVIERPEIVFKGGVGYASEAIYAQLAGQIGIR